jgi:hypothetical protein
MLFCWHVLGVVNGLLQVGFFDIVIIPLFHTYSKVFVSCRPLLTYVMRNYRYWADQQVLQAQQQEAGPAAAAGPAQAADSSKQ